MARRLGVREGALVALLTAAIWIGMLGAAFAARQWFAEGSPRSSARVSPGE
jgi:hypothetical protein